MKPLRTASFIFLALFAVTAYAKDTVTCPYSSQINTQPLGAITIPVVTSKSNSIINFTGKIKKEVKSFFSADLNDGKLNCVYRNSGVSPTISPSEAETLTATVPKNSTFDTYLFSGLGSGSCLSIVGCALVL